jgi:hypothetical protein|nr:MAG TPA: hypothetical protein [Caudoviricetes sp.]
MIFKLFLMIAYFIICHILIAKCKSISFILAFVFPIVAWFSPLIPRWYVFILAFSTISNAFGNPGRTPVYNQPLYMRKYGPILSIIENGLLLIGLVWMIYSGITSFMSLF